MNLFRKDRRDRRTDCKKAEVTEMERAMEGLRELGIADCFYSKSVERAKKKNKLEENREEHKGVIEKCKEILREYEERIAREELQGKN